MTKNEMLMQVALFQAEQMRKSMCTILDHGLKMSDSDISELELEMRVRETELAEAIAAEMSEWPLEEVRFFYMLIKVDTYRSICERQRTQGEAFMQLGTEWMQTLLRSTDVL